MGPAAAPPEPAPPTGIDYLGLLAARHQQALAGRRIGYADLASPDQARDDQAVDADIASIAALRAGTDSLDTSPEVPGQLDLTELPELADTGGAR